MWSKVILGLVLISVDVSLTSWLVDLLFPTMQFALRNSVGAIDLRNEARVGKSMRGEPVDAPEKYSFSANDAMLFGACVTTIALPTWIIVCTLNPKKSWFAFLVPISFCTAIATMQASVDVIAATVVFDLQIWIKSLIVSMMILMFIGSDIVLFLSVFHALRIKDHINDFERMKDERRAAKAESMKLVERV